ncbi:hypothetical protein C8K30_102328 [Promicromonospora sp. AC04]|nr:hypothetical protein C8K30_102328 [Promicromonospora sp. AC04]
MWKFPRRAVLAGIGVLVVAGTVAASQPAPAPVAQAAPPASAGTTSTGPPTTFPTVRSAGLPPGWSPKKTHTGDLWIRKAGTVVKDLRIRNGVVYVAARNVTLRRVQAVNAVVINDVNGKCGSGLLIERSTFVSTGRSGETDLPVIGNGGFTVRDVKIDGVPEGIRVGSKHCGGVTVADSFIRIEPPHACRDWHGDGIQGYNGGRLVVRMTTITLRERANCPGNAPFFYPDGQGNTSLSIDGLLVRGGGYPFRAGTHGTVRNLQVVKGSWGYAAVEVSCPDVAVRRSHVVTVTGSGRTKSVGALDPCRGGGS